ncbi:MAG TPA: formimidoylglutamate deiminase [Caulobacteraceae bacterium]|nr:formimidoylglutamate deiminase [Caulobacteraceae bacterium]
MASPQPTMESLWFETALLPQGWRRGVRLTAVDGLISKVETDASPAPADERGAIAVPGLGNVHSHAFQRALAGLTERRGPAEDDFWTWREAMYAFLERLGPDDVEAIATLAYCEMLEAGFTRVGEFHYLHHDPHGRPYADPAEMAGRIAAAAAASGIGLTLLPVFYAHSGFGGAPPAPGQRRFVAGLDGFARLLEASAEAIGPLPDAILGLAPHSLRAVTPEELAEITPLAGRGGIHIHAAEQTAEVDACVSWSGQRPVAWLLDHAGVDQSWRLIHATHMTAAETARLAASGAVAGLCPITEADLGDGVFPARTYLDAGGRFGVGTDSNVRIDAAGELRALEYAQRLTARRRNLLAGPEQPSVGAFLFRAALAGGAQALGVEPGLRIGAAMDVLALDGDHPSFVGATGDSILDRWIFAGGPIDRVWRRGACVVRQGRHVRRRSAAAAYRRSLSRLLAA